MKLAVFLPLGGSIADMAMHGQDKRFINYYLHSYCREFDEVFVFSYAMETCHDLPSRCYLVTPKFKLHRYIYSFLLPWLQMKSYLKCDVSRCFHLNSTIPAIMGKLFFRKKFVFNYNYDYKKWAMIEGKYLLLPLFWVLEPIVFFLADHIFVADKIMEKYAQKFTSSKKITIIPNGVDTSLFKPAKKLPSSKKTILSVGRLETQKNYSQLISAVAGLTPKPNLVFVGRGSLKQSLINQADELDVNLKIVDMIPHQNLPGIYRMADVYVQPSLIEAPVKTLLEAMSCGVPCVATDVPGIRDVIQDNDNGLLAQLDSGDLESKIAKILSDGYLANKLGRKARKTIVSKYNLLHFLEEEANIMKKV